MVIIVCVNILVIRVTRVRYEIVYISKNVTAMEKEIEALAWTSLTFIATFPFMLRYPNL